MKSGRLFWGLLLITVGTLFLLASVFNVNLNVGELYKFWPVALILWGISVFVKHDLAKTIIAGLAGVVIGLIFYSLVIKPYACIKESTDFDSCEEIKEVMLDSLNFPVPKESRVIDFSIQGGGISILCKGNARHFSPLHHKRVQSDEANRPDQRDGAGQLPGYSSKQG